MLLENCDRGQVCWHRHLEDFGENDLGWQGESRWADQGQVGWGWDGESRGDKANAASHSGEGWDQLNSPGSKPAKEI